MNDEQWLNFSQLIEASSPGSFGVGANEDGSSVMLSWDKGRHHLEVELFKEKPAEVFYRDRETGETWSWPEE